ncbi:MAG: hypothetical protein FJ304_24800 [Planctomycetes bacterium]|nr:hypothetical protein [Planctomycetota bacterium]
MTPQAPIKTTEPTTAPHGQIYRAPAPAPTSAAPRPHECLYPELADPTFFITPEQCPCGA